MHLKPLVRPPATSALASIAALFLTLGVSRADPATQTNSSFEPADLVSRIEADRLGIRSTGTLKRALSERTTFAIEMSDAYPKRFGLDRLNHTLESHTELKFETDLATGGLWTVAARSSRTEQDIGLFGRRSEGLSYRYQAYSISNGWLGKLTENLSLEILAGLAQCRSADDGRSRLIPLGGVRLVRDFDWGEVVASVFQDAEGNGSVSGIYGSQSERRLSLEVRFALARGFTLSWDCGLLFAQVAFRTEGFMKN